MSVNIEIEFMVEDDFDKEKFLELGNSFLKEKISQKDVKKDRFGEDEFYEYETKEKPLVVSFYWYPNRKVVVTFLYSQEGYGEYAFEIMKKIAVKTGIGSRAMSTGDIADFEEYRLWAVNVFSPKEVEMYGRDLLKSLPVDRVEELEGGPIFVIVDEDKNWQTNSFGISYGGAKKKWEKAVKMMGQKPIEIEETLDNEMTPKKIRIHFVIDETFNKERFFELCVSFIGERLESENFEFRDWASTTGEFKNNHYYYGANKIINEGIPNVYDEWFFEFWWYLNSKEVFGEVYMDSVEKIFEMMKRATKESGIGCKAIWADEEINPVFQKTRFWAVNVFSQSEVKMYGRNLLKSLPASRIEELEGGLIFMIVDENKNYPWDSFSTKSGKIEKVWKAFKEEEK